MDIYQAIILAIIQGVTEFLPISSSAHLILIPKIVNWQDQGLSFDIAVHFGTLLSVIIYFRKIIISLKKDFFLSIINQKLVGNSKISWGIVMATIPVGLVGLISHDFIENNLRSVEVIAWTTVIFAITLGIADFYNKSLKQRKNVLSWSCMFLIGCAQALALVPGTSRSGITLTIGLLLGLNRKLAAQFAFLLAIPVIALSAGLEVVKILEQPNFGNWLFLTIGFIISFITAYITIKIFMMFIEKYTLIIWVIYRLILGLFLILFL